MAQVPPVIIADRFSMMPVVASILLICFLIIPQELLSALVNRYGSFDLDLRLLDYFGLVFALGVIIVFVRKALRIHRHSRPKSSISYLVSAVLIFFGLIFMNSLIGLFQYTKLYLLSEQFDECKRRATAYSEVGAFKICSARIHGNAYQIIAYDSGRQLEIGAEHRSEAFKHFLRLRVSPVLSSCDFRASRISDAFYYVQADCG